MEDYALVMPLPLFFVLGFLCVCGLAFILNTIVHYFSGFRITRVVSDESETKKIDVPPQT